MDDLVARELVAMLPRLRRFARGLAGSSTDGDDIVQMACEKAVDRIHQWQPGTRLDSWMYRIIQTVHLDWRRAERARANHLQFLADVDTAHPNGLAAFETHITMEQVRRTLAILPDDQRAILLLVCVEGFSYKEAAEILGIPIGTVMSRLARGRAVLHERFGTTGDVVADA